MMHATRLAGHTVRLSPPGMEVKSWDVTLPGWRTCAADARETIQGTGSVGGGTLMNISEAGVALSVLNGFELTYLGSRVSLPSGAQRLLVLLTLQNDALDRATAAERLWPDRSPQRAAANLRSALWRSRAFSDTTVIECAGPQLRLSPLVRVDLHDARWRARSVTVTDGWPTLVDALSRELLPGWTEDWLVLERQRWDQERVHSLETLAQALRSSGLYLNALQTALAAIAVEPIRETAHRIVVDTHLAEGNAGCALKHYQRYRALLAHELGVTPSARMTELVSELLPR